MIIMIAECTCDRCRKVIYVHCHAQSYVPDKLRQFHGWAVSRDRIHCYCSYCAQLSRRSGIWRKKKPSAEAVTNVCNAKGRERDVPIDVERRVRAR